MRSIKFRCFNKGTGKMIDLYKITPVALDANLNCDGLFIPFKKGYEIMQFTGLTDKNGKEIYEGDIIQAHDKSIGIVTFGGGCFRWQGGPILWDSDSATDVPTEEWATIIGNIYENQELIPK